MIKLKDIKREGNIVSATVTTVEKTPQTFEVSVDVVSGKIHKNTLGRMSMDVGMAIGKLITLAEESGNKLPTKAESIWY